MSTLLAPAEDDPRQRRALARFAAVNWIENAIQNGLSFTRSVQAAAQQQVSSNDTTAYDVSRDGQRFLINTPVKQGVTQPMSVVLNWTAKLNK